MTVFVVTIGKGGKDGIYFQIGFSNWDLAGVLSLDYIFLVINQNLLHEQHRRGTEFFQKHLEKKKNLPR